MFASTQDCKSTGLLLWKQIRELLLIIEGVDLLAHQAVVTIRMSFHFIVLGFFFLLVDQFAAMVTVYLLQICVDNCSFSNSLFNLLLW